MAAFAQNITVSGVVLDAARQPIIGAFVVEQGTSNGTSASLDGEFSLKVAPGSVLEVSCIGYVTRTVTVSNEQRLEIILEDDTQMLEETVVVGYGVQKKSVVTASISKVDGDALNKVRASTVNDAIKGKVSGVQITQASGQPGSGSQIKIRGIGSVNNSDPLYIVDGMAVVAVVVGPVADSQHQRSQQQKPAPTTMSDAVGTDANPNGESIEGEHISVVALTRFIAGVVEVEIKNNATEKEKQKDNMEIAPTTTPVAPQAPDSQQKRKHKGHDEIPLEVLASNEIIHQIAAVHIAELVCEPVF